MKILAIDSSGLVASAAVMTEETLIAEYTLNFKKTHSQTLLPMIDEIMRMTQTEPSHLEAIAVAQGPGSFTGLRIGSATAKGLGLALGVPLIGISTLEALAYNLYGTGDSLICPLMDARRNQVYTGLYKLTDSLDIIEPECAVPLEEIISIVNDHKKHVIYLGDGVDAYKEQIERLTAVPYSFAPAHMSKQRAGAVGRRAFELISQGKVQTAAEHAPVYLRMSQAERELMERNNENADSQNAGK